MGLDNGLNVLRFGSFVVECIVATPLLSYLNIYFSMGSKLSQSPPIFVLSDSNGSRMKGLFCVFSLTVRMKLFTIIAIADLQNNNAIFDPRQALKNKLEIR